MAATLPGIDRQLTDELVLGFEQSERAPSSASPPVSILVKSADGGHLG
jgi:hypothetical protein